jgi:two-component system sensor histidine kinase BarA
VVWLKYKFKRFAAAIVVYILGVLLIASVSYIQERERFLADIDQRLLAAASNIPAILPENFHDIARNPKAISYEQDQHNLELMTLHTTSGDLTYLYTYVMVDGAIYFTACNYTVDDIEKNQVVTYWTGYPEGAPEYFDAMTADEPIYVTAGDNWGLFRTILMPMTSPAGYPYVAAADMDITVIENTLKHAFLSVIGMSIVLLTIAAPLIFAYRSTFLEMNTELVKLNKQLRSDINQALILEAELKEATHNANRANKIKGQFLSNMSHELRTPINGISGMNQLLIDTGLDDEQQEYIDMSNLSAQVLLDTVNQILDVAAIEAGGLKLQLEKVKTEDYLNDIVVLFVSQAAKKQLDLVLSIADGVPAEIKIDPVNLRKVFINLIGNAIKFTQLGGIRIEISWHDGQLKGMVQDTGMGIPDCSNDRIFEAFQQVDNSYTREFSGTGLGLPISQQICEVMGGKLFLTRSNDLGSVFEFHVQAAAVGNEFIRRFKFQFEQSVCVFTDSDILKNWFLVELNQPTLKRVSEIQAPALVLDTYDYIFVDANTTSDALLLIAEKLDLEQQKLVYLSWAGNPLPESLKERVQLLRKPMLISTLAEILRMGKIS